MGAQNKINMREYTAIFKNEKGELDHSWICCDNIEDAMKMFKQDCPGCTDITISGYESVTLKADKS